jgi:aminoglycoside phosphotransferase (APT) family kinase protein
MDLKSVILDQTEAERFTAYQKTFFFTKVDGVYPVDILNTHIDVHTPHIRKIFTQKLGTEADNITELSRRTLHYVYKVDTVKGPFIVRINACGHFYRELSFYTETWIMKELQDRSLPHLEIFDVDTSRTLVPFDYEIMSGSSGETLFDLSTHSEMPLMVVGQLGAFVASIHEIKTQKYGPFGISSILSGSPTGLHESWLSYQILNMVSHIESCALVGVINQAEATEIANSLAGIGKIQVINPVFLHGDVANHNTFVEGGKITAIIDWEDCTSGDPVYDVAYYGSGCYGHDDWFNAFLSGYKSIRHLPDDFEKRYWIYFLRVSLVKALVRERFSLKRNTYLPDARQRILHALAQAKNYSI